MDSINQISRQLRELFESMTPGGRVTAALLMVVVVVSVGFLFQQSTAGPDEYLFGGEPLTSSQINAMTGAMSQAGLNGWEVEGAHIRVPRSERHAYIAAVADAGVLPTSAKDFMSKALTGSPWTSREVQKQQMKLALEQELSHILGWYPWVDRASVVYDVKSVRGPRAKEIASATVSIMPAPGESLTGPRARNIQKLVAGGFTSMSPDDVSVSSLGDDDSFGAFGGDEDAMAFESPYHRERVRVENEKRREILSHLSHIPGVRVQVNAVLDDIVQQNVLESRPDTPVTISEVIGGEEITETTTDAANRPGAVANGPTSSRDDQQPTREDRRTVTTNSSNTTNVVGELTTQELHAGLVPREINASIQIPRSFVIDYWKQEQQELTGEVPESIEVQQLETAEADVITDIEELVTPLLPKQIAQSEYKQVKVVVMGTVPSEPLPEPSMASGILAWTSRHSSALAMVGVAVFSLLMLRSVVRSSPDSDASGAPVLQLGEMGDVPGGVGDDDDEDEDGRPKLKLRKADSLKDDLSEIVREDPEAAAAILRGWIGNAS